MEEARFFPSESGLQRKTELRSVHSFHQNAMPFAPCATQGSERHPFLLPALRRAPKETLFCSLRYAGLRKTPFFASCVAQGSKTDPFLLPALRRAPKDTLFCFLRCAGAENRPFFASCVAQGSERHPFLLPALRRALKETLFCFLRNAGPERDPFLLPALRRAPKDDAFQSGANKKSVQTVAARTLSSMLSLKSKILMPVASWSGHTCQRSQQPWRHRRLRLPRCRPQSAACGSSVHRHSPA